MDQLEEALSACCEESGVGRGERFVVDLDGAARSEFGGWITTEWDFQR